MNSFTDLDVWKVGMSLVESIYDLTHNFPKQEQYGLTNQMRRASTSILANVAEGFSRHTYADKAHKYVIARGECSELTAFLFIARTLKFGNQQKISHAIQSADRVGRMLSGLIRAYRT